jgi:hypothetical protein
MKDASAALKGIRRAAKSRERADAARAKATDGATFFIAASKSPLVGTGISTGSPCFGLVFCLRLVMRLIVPVPDSDLLQP